MLADLYLPAHMFVCAYMRLFVFVYFTCEYAYKKITLIIATPPFLLILNKTQRPYIKNLIFSEYYIKKTNYSEGGSMGEGGWARLCHNKVIAEVWKRLSHKKSIGCS